MRTFLKAAAVAPALLTATIALAAPASAQKTPAAVIVTVDNERIVSESNAFKAALQAFGVTWKRKAKAVEKVPA